MFTLELSKDAYIRTPEFKMCNFNFIGLSDMFIIR
jgi:hypothetical protein